MVGVGSDVLVGTGVEVEVAGGVGETSVAGSGVEVNKANSDDGVTLDIGCGAQDIKVNPKKNTIAPILQLVMSICLLKNPTTLGGVASCTTKRQVSLTIRPMLSLPPG
jgi:hypothetical protein